MHKQPGGTYDVPHERPAHKSGVPVHARVLAKHDLDVEGRAGGEDGGRDQRVPGIEAQLCPVRVTSRHTNGDTALQP